MFTLHVSSHLTSSVRGLALCWFLLATALAAQAQTQAACTFNFFSNTAKIFKNGTTHKLDFPGVLVTQPNGINDNGTVVGSYLGADGSLHGFIFHNCQWATLDYPHASDTVLVGITNAGKIIGNAFKNISITPFL